jgi:DMSO/TMAO reductase YedYZ molybdopterin-dependent catalytic subunit
MGLQAGRGMEPENVKPESVKPENVKPDTGESKAGDPEVADPKIIGGEGPGPRAADAKAEAKASRPKSMHAPMTERRFSQVSRRELLKVAPMLALGAFAIPRLRDSLLRKGLGFSDWASEKLFRRGHLAPVFADAELTPFEKFPVNGYDVDDPGVIFENWTLTVGGAVEKAGEYRLAQIQALPRVRQNTRHICVEGWDVIGRFGGARLSDFLNMIGADTSARFLTVACADDYYESLDMATALHPQTLLCYEMCDQPLTRKHGAPLRLNIPTKVGYKQAKYLTEMKVTHVLEKVGYWEDQGYSSFYGL